MSKADEPATPTEDQVKVANEAEEAKWQGDFPEENLTIPYKREDDSASTDKSKATDNSEDDPENEEENTEVVTYSDPEPIVTVQDPGDYKPADYSFEVTLKDGKSVKVSTPEDAEKLADDPENFETPKQLMDFINKQNKMNTKLDKDKSDYDQRKAEFDTQTETEESRQANIENFTAEFKYLADKGLMPKIPKEFMDADWQDPEIAKQPGVKEQIELLDYMVKENETRMKAKVKPLTSIVDAYNAWQLDTGRKQQEADNKAAGEARKAAGARVAGVSPSQQGSFVPKGIAVGNPNVMKRGAAVWDNQV